MKLFIFGLLATLSLNSFAVSIDTAGLLDVEIQAIDEATPAEFKLLVDCMNDQNETKINETSCINDVLGDVHN